MTANASKLAVLFANLAKLGITSSQFDAMTLGRMAEVNSDLTLSIVKGLDELGMKAPRISETLSNHENWLLLNRENVAKKFESLRQVGLSSDISEYLIAKNPEVMEDAKMVRIRTNLDELNYFLSRQQINSVLLKSPKLATVGNLASFIYKFTYVYVLMGIKQDEMCTSLVFDHDIDHIRQRHLFLSRAGLYDKPDKRGLTRVDNPKLAKIVDTKLRAYLKSCTRNMFDACDYQTFCAYMSQEDFTDELLGFNIGKSLRDQIIAQIKDQKRIENKEELI
jgi:hypothetical protein